MKVKKDREEFLAEIEKRQEGLKKLEAYVYLVLEEANTFFRDVHSPVEKSLDEIKMNYYELFLRSSSTEELRKHYRDAENDLDSLIKESPRNISSFFTERLTKIGEKFSEDYNISIPRIDLRSIEESCKKELLKERKLQRKKLSLFLKVGTFLNPGNGLNQLALNGS